MSGFITHGFIKSIFQSSIPLHHILGGTAVSDCCQHSPCYTSLLQIQGPLLTQPFSGFIIICANIRKTVGAGPDICVIGNHLYTCLHCLRSLHIKHLRFQCSHGNAICFLVNRLLYHLDEFLRPGRISGLAGFHHQADSPFPGLLFCTVNQRFPVRPFFIQRNQIKHWSLPAPGSRTGLVCAPRKTCSRGKDQTGYQP